MKKALAVMLTLILLAALIPTVAFADADYVLEIKGGNTCEYMETADGVDCLRVDVYLSGITDERLLASTGFSLEYDSSQLTYVTDSQKKGVTSLYAINGNGKFVSNISLIMNPTEEGVILFAMATSYGCRIKENTPLISLYFRISDSVANGDEIAFTLGKNPTIESIDLKDLQEGVGKTTKRTLVADFKPYVLANTVGTIEWNANDVQFNKKTPFVLYNGKAQTPRFIVKDENGSVIDASYYDYEFKENTLAGTAYLFVTFKNGLSGTCDSFFKIYLPATTKTTVENVKDGIKLTWAPVEGAAGYVIYRRAWSTTTDGWTSFERWWNVTETTWTDGTIENHMVYAGTRYQYGVKAYFAKRLDPISGDYIGGNENIPLGNWNLGIVGPLRTTVRITTRVLNEVVGGSNQVTVKWAKSANFTGYEVQIATDANFTNIAETKIIDNWKIGEATFQGLKANTTYYARVRSYHEFEGFTYYGEWSNVLNAKTN